MSHSFSSSANVRPRFCESFDSSDFEILFFFHVRVERAFTLVYLSKSDFIMTSFELSSFAFPTSGVVVLVDSA
jgi:hypothetical protein